MDCMVQYLDERHFCHLPEGHAAPTHQCVCWKTWRSE